MSQAPQVLVLASLAASCPKLTCLFSLAACSVLLKCTGQLQEAYTIALACIAMYKMVVAKTEECKFLLACAYAHLASLLQEVQFSSFPPPLAPESSPSPCLIVGALWRGGASRRQCVGAGHRSCAGASQLTRLTRLPALRGDSLLPSLLLALLALLACISSISPPFPVFSILSAVRRVAL
jgi:hypothetical protein